MQEQSSRDSNGTEIEDSFTDMPGDSASMAQTTTS